MRDQHAEVQALAARGLGLRAIARELGVDRKTARRFAHATTGDQAVARAISRPTVLDRYQPHLHRRWNEGCHDTAVLHAEISALGYRGSLRNLYRYLQPLRSGTAPAALTPSALKIGEVTSWLLRRAEDLIPPAAATGRRARPLLTARPPRRARDRLRQDDDQAHRATANGRCSSALTPTTSPSCIPSPPGSATTWPRSPPG